MPMAEINAEDQQREGVNAEAGQQRQPDGAEIRRDHIDFAVSEIDHPDNAVNHGVADGDQTVDSA